MVETIRVRLWEGFGWRDVGYIVRAPRVLTLRDAPSASSDRIAERRALCVRIGREWYELVDSDGAHRTVRLNDADALPSDLMQTPEGGAQ